MSNIKFKVKIERCAILDPKLTHGKPMVVGYLDEYVKTENEIQINVRLLDDIPDNIREAIEKNPSCMLIAEKPGLPEEVLIIPSRPKLVV